MTRLRLCNTILSPLTTVPLYRKPPAHCWTGQPFQAASSEYWEMGWQMSASSPSPEKIIKISWPNFKGNYENPFLTLTRIRVSSLGIERTLFSTSASVTSIKEQLEFWSIMGNMPCPVTQGWHYYWNSVFSQLLNANIHLYFLECDPFLRLLCQHSLQQLDQLGGDFNWFQNLKKKKNR